MSWDHIFLSLHTFVSTSTQERELFSANIATMEIAWLEATRVISRSFPWSTVGSYSNCKGDGRWYTRLFLCGWRTMLKGTWYNGNQHHIVPWSETRHPCAFMTLPIQPSISPLSVRFGMPNLLKTCVKICQSSGLAKSYTLLCIMCACIAARVRIKVQVHKPRILSISKKSIFC